jgi:hypothetical protein
MIAFTSQLAHVVSSAYVKSEAALNHKGFSAGSFKDMTRVARLNEYMWTELFMDNSEYLTEEVDALIDRLAEYKFKKAFCPAPCTVAELRRNTIPQSISVRTVALFVHS